MANSTKIAAGTVHSVEFNGKTFTRKSEGRTYTHCVAVVARAQAARDGWSAREEEGFILTWCGRRDLAEKAAATARGENQYTGTEGRGRLTGRRYIAPKGNGPSRYLSVEVLEVAAEVKTLTASRLATTLRKRAEKRGAHALSLIASEPATLAMHAAKYEASVADWAGRAARDAFRFAAQALDAGAQAAPVAVKEEAAPAASPAAPKFEIIRNERDAENESRRTGRVTTSTIITWDVVEIATCALVGDYKTRREAKAALARLEASAPLVAAEERAAAAKTVACAATKRGAVKTSRRGGKRAGAGRKAGAQGKRDASLTVRLTTAQRRALATLARARGVALSAVVGALIDSEIARRALDVIAERERAETLKRNASQIAVEQFEARQAAAQAPTPAAVEPVEVVEATAPFAGGPTPEETARYAERLHDPARIAAAISGEPEPSKRVFLVIAPHAWGKGETEAEAIRNARKNFSPSLSGKFRYIVFDADSETYVDEMGGLCYIPKKGVAPYTEIRRVGLPAETSERASKAARQTSKGGAK